MGNCCPCRSSEKHPGPHPDYSGCTLSLTRSQDVGSSPQRLTHNADLQFEGLLNERELGMLVDSATVNGSHSVVSPGSGSHSVSDLSAGLRNSRGFYGLIPPIVAARNSGSPNCSDPKRTNNNTITMGSGSSSHLELSENKLQSLYDEYRDPIDDFVSEQGILKLCRDLDVEPDDFSILLFAWKCDALQMGKLTRQELLQGCHRLGVDSISLLKSRLPELVIEVRDSEKFGEMYRYAFRFALEADSGQRSLPVDVAASLWRLVFASRKEMLVDLWLDFLEQSPPPVRAIPRDTWHMFLHLVDTIGDDLSRYDDTEAWPSLFDDFVEWANDRANQNVNVISKESN